MSTISLTRRSLLQGLAGAALGANKPGRPNILFLFPDQWRFDWLQSTPGLEVRTPHIAALAARGTSFSKAIVPAPVCAPSRACLASGKEYSRCRVASNGVDYPLDQTTHYKLMRDAGYNVLACGKIDLHKKTKNWGLDGKRCLPEWGFSGGIDNAGKGDAVSSGAVTPKDPYMAYLHKRELAAMHVADFRKRSQMGYAATFPTPLPGDAYCDNWVGRNGLELLSNAPKDRPWYLTVNFVGPHDPEDITAEMEPTVRGRRFPQPNGSTEFTPEIHVAIRQNYTAMVENIDRLIGRFIDEVKRRGELDNTVIVFASDHGEMLGDHDRWGKQLPWHPSVSVPLVIAGPGVRKNHRIDSPVTTLDLTATHLDYAGLAPAPDMDSKSLRPLLEGKTKHGREIVTSALYGWRMAWDGRYKLIHGFDPTVKMKGEGKADATPSGTLEPLLFDLMSDPQENQNIFAKAPAHAKTPGGGHRLSRCLLIR